MSWILNSGGKSNLTSDAGSGQKIVNVVNGSLFAAGDWVEIMDDNAFEINEIDSISVNQLIMVNNLANTYTTAANGKVTKEVILPHDPKKIQCKVTALSKQSTYPDDLPLVLSIGKKATVLSFEATIWEADKTKAELEKEYIELLDGLNHTVVTISAPGTRYDGDWLFDDFATVEPRGFSTIFQCKFKFLKGKEYLVV